MFIFLPLEEAEETVQKARDTLLEHGYDTDHVEIYFSYVFPHSYCVEGAAGDISVVLGVYSRLTDEPDDFIDWVYHELAHAWILDHWESMSTYYQRKFRKLFGDIDDTPTVCDVWFYDRDFADQEYVSAYAVVAPEEDWAETFAEFFREGQPIEDYPEVVQEKLKFVSRIVTHFGVEIRKAA